MSIGAWKLAVLGLTTGGGLLFKTLRNQKRARIAEDTPRSKIASAPQGFVESQGLSWPAGGGFTTIDGDIVTFYDFQLQKEMKRSEEKRRKEWVTVASYKFSDPFFMVDATGLAVIHTEKAEFEIKAERVRDWRKLNEKQQEFALQNLVAQKVDGFPPAKGLLGIFASPFRIVEKEIRAGSPLFVTGTFSTDPGMNDKFEIRGLNEFASKVFDPQRRDLKDLRRFLDKNGDGNVSEEEARDGYSFLARLCLQKATSGREESPPEGPKQFEIFGHFEATEESKLLIADVFEEQLIHRLRKFKTLKIVGGAALIAVSAAFLLRDVLSIAIGGKQVREKVIEAMAHNQPKVMRAPSNNPQASKEPEEDGEWTQAAVSRWHTACLGQRSVGACRELLIRKEQLGLSPYYIEIYSKTACQLGDTYRCPSKPTNSSPDANAARSNSPQQ